MIGLKYAITACLVLAFGFLAWPRATASAFSEDADFKRDIEPIFAANCTRCHGPRRSRGQLRLDAKSLAMKGGISGPVIIPRKSKESRLMKRILGEDGEPRMPMGGDPLKPDQIE